ncbi:MAG: glycosyltransferase family 4 protein [Alphaproteobacteria bacterium]|nr:glycosyltransferase family 4 protein [Alphaproteobacteria bacterium]
MRGRIFYDGLNVPLAQGTGIATYTRMLTTMARDIGYEVGIVYNARRTPPKNRVLREVAFFDEQSPVKTSWTREAIDWVTDEVRNFAPVRPVPVVFSDVVITRQFEAMLPTQDYVFAVRNLFSSARRHFARTNTFVKLAFDPAPDIMHCTYQLPLRSDAACNIYTIHDLVPLRLPFTTLDNKRQMFRLLRKLAKTADHIVTVSENSKRDIVQLLGIEERRITNTYQAVYVPEQLRALPDSIVSERLESAFNLDFQGYLLFFGALEPKKNVGRLIEAYLSSGVDIPLVLIASQGWQNDAETTLISQLRGNHRIEPAFGERARRAVRRFDFVPFSMLISMIRGARAVLFPSLYEGFGLPVLESMLLGTPVVTSRESSIPEVAGDAALLVDPYDTEEIAAAIRTIVFDGDLRDELRSRGYDQAEKFSVDHYRERVAALYRSLS